MVRLARHEQLLSLPADLGLARPPYKDVVRHESLLRLLRDGSFDDLREVLERTAAQQHPFVTGYLAVALHRHWCNSTFNHLGRVLLEVLLGAAQGDGGGAGEAPFDSAVIYGAGASLPWAIAEVSTPGVPAGRMVGLDCVQVKSFVAASGNAQLQQAWTMLADGVWVFGDVESAESGVAALEELLGGGASAEEPQGRAGRRCTWSSTACGGPWGCGPARRRGQAPWASGTCW